MQPQPGTRPKKPRLGAVFFIRVVFYTLNRDYVCKLLFLLDWYEAKFDLYSFVYSLYISCLKCIIFVLQHCLNNCSPPTENYMNYETPAERFSQFAGRSKASMFW